MPDFATEFAIVMGDQQGDEVNYGVDISTLTRLIESGEIWLHQDVLSLFGANASRGDVYLIETGASALAMLASPLPWMLAL